MLYSHHVDGYMHSIICNDFMIIRLNTGKDSFQVYAKDRQKSSF